MTTNHKCDHFKMSYWVILERTSHKPAIGCPFFSNVEQESVVQADSMSPSPPQTVVNLSTVERLFCQSSADANWQNVAVLSGEAKQNGVEELLCIHCSTEPLSLMHTGHSRWGDTCHSAWYSAVWGTLQTSRHMLKFHKGRQTRSRICHILQYSTESLKC